MKQCISCVMQKIFPVTSRRVTWYNPLSFPHSFYRTPMPFGSTMASKRVIPVIGFEAVEPQKLPGVALDRMCRRPNFNRAPRGWGIDYSPESNELWERLYEIKPEAQTLSLWNGPSVDCNNRKEKLEKKKRLQHNSGLLLMSVVSIQRQAIMGWVTGSQCLAEVFTSISDRLKTKSQVFVRPTNSDQPTFWKCKRWSIKTRPST